MSSSSPTQIQEPTERPEAAQTQESGSASESGNTSESHETPKHRNIPKCTYCKHPAIHVCSRCKDAPAVTGGPPKPYYCSKECQIASWPSHRGDCQWLLTRLVLYRVAATAQMLFYIYREMTWYQFDIVKVEEKEHYLLVYGKVLYNARWPYDRKRFPSELVPDRQDKEAILTYMAYRFAVGFMSDFLAGMFRDTVAVVNVVDITYKNARRETVIQPLTQADFDARFCHQVMEVVLDNGESYAVDICGAQFGSRDPVTPWEEFQEAHIHEVLYEERLPLPDSLFDFDKVDALVSHQIRSLVAHTSLEHGVRSERNQWRDYVELMNAAIIDWQRKEQLLLPKIWKMPEGQFLMLQENLVDFIELSLQGKEDKVGPDYGTARKMELRARKKEIVRKLT